MTKITYGAFQPTCGNNCDDYYAGRLLEVGVCTREIADHFQQAICKRHPVCDGRRAEIGVGDFED